MSYSAEISRGNPSCFLFLIDQSGSMAGPFGGGLGQRQKADGVADAINRLLQNLVLKCAKSEGIRDYYHVGVIGYGSTVAQAFGGTLAGRDLIPISEIANKPLRVESRNRKVEDGAGGLVEQAFKFPVWFEPLANGGTPMSQALAVAKAVLTGWLASHPSCFPPVLVNVTDGEATDGDPSNTASELVQLNSNDGNVLLFNVHVSSQPGNPIEFPDNEEALPDQFAKLLFRMSSILPPFMRSAAVGEGYRTSERTRGFVFNGSLESVIKFLDIGTRPANLR